MFFKKKKKQTADTIDLNNLPLHIGVIMDGNGRWAAKRHLPRSAGHRAGADTFVSGRLDYHSMTDAPDQKVKKMNLIEAGHFFTEDPVCSVLRKFVLDIDPILECDIYSSNTIKAI